MSERIAVFADVHANYAALSAVLADISAQAVDAVWCLGDMIGRGPQPIPTLNRLWGLYRRQAPRDQAAWLLGNHELVILGKVLTGWAESSIIGANDEQATIMDERHRHAIQASPHCDKLTAFLTHLNPYTAQPPRPGVYLAHAHYALHEDGNVDEVKAYAQYVGDDANVSAALRDLIARLPENRRLRMVITAHTHKSGLWQWNPASQAALPVPSYLEGIHSLSTLSARPVYINPGSTGFPRLPDDMPSYVILTLGDDHETAQIEFRRVEYYRDEIVWPSDYPESLRKEIESTSRLRDQP